MKIEPLYTRDLNKFKPILNGMYDDFGYKFVFTILAWTGLMRDEPEDKSSYWQLWLMKIDGKIGGICGLYTIPPNNKKDMWISWFGVIPKFRNNGLGVDILKFTESRAKRAGCRNLYVDVMHNAKPSPISFYERNGFEVLCTAQQLIDTYPNRYHEDYFYNKKSIIMIKKLK